MAKHPWRVQGDIAYGDTDPVLTVFMGEVETDEEGVASVRQDTRNPVTMKLSELGSASHLADPKRMQACADKQKAARLEAKAKADAEFA